MSESTSNKNYKNGHRNRKFRPHSKKKQGLLEEESKTAVFIDNNNNSNSKDNLHKSITVNERVDDISNNKNLGICTNNTRKNKKDLYKNKRFFIHTNSNSSSDNSQKKSNGPLKTLYTKDFTFKNGKEQKNKYCHIGIQTLKPIQLHINRIFNQGCESSYIPSLKEEAVNTNNLFQIDEDNIGINDEINYRRSSGGITNINARKWSNASTLAEDSQINIPNTFQKSTSISSSVTLTDTSATTNMSLSNKNDLSNQNKIFLKDPYLVKNPLTVEDLNSTNILKIERDVERLKRAINKKNNSDTFTIENNTDINDLQCDDSLTTNVNHHEDSNIHANILMDIWLDYPTCCYHSLIKE